jgi:hypothetical protein
LKLTGLLQVRIPFGDGAIALRQTASRAGGNSGFTCRGGSHSPRWALRRISAVSLPSIGRLPVKIVYSVAPKLMSFDDQIQ